MDYQHDPADILVVFPPTLSGSDVYFDDVTNTFDCSENMRT